MLGFFVFDSYGKALIFVNQQLGSGFQIHDCFWSGEQALVIASGAGLETINSGSTQDTLFLEPNDSLLHFIAGGGLTIPQEEIVVVESGSWLSLIKCLDLVIKDALQLVDFRLVRGGKNSKSIMIVTGVNLQSFEFMKLNLPELKMHHIVHVSTSLKSQIDFSIG
jgi:hypothetical protein